MKSIATRVAAIGLIALGGCAGAGNLGDILGGVMNAPAQGQTQTASGTIQSVDTRNMQIYFRTTDNQSVTIAYDGQTDVIYQNQSYPVSALEPGDRVNLRVIQTSNGGYYTDRVEVTQSVSANTGSNDNADLRTVEGTVRQIDQTNGAFTIATSNQGVLTVTLPYNPRANDVDRFRALRAGDYVRIYGVFLTSSRVELRQFN